LFHYPGKLPSFVDHDSKGLRFSMAKPSDIADVCQAQTDASLAQAAPDSALDDLIGYAMRRAQLKLFQNLTGRLCDHALRPAQFSALAIIDGNPGLMQADLARALAIEPPQVVPLLNKLESRALALRVRCKPDKRSYGIYLSKGGEALLKELKKIAAQSDLDATAALDNQEREQLLRLLKKIYQQ
jgi:DNA-binding MarR family transcriptional regulator